MNNSPFQIDTSSESVPRKPQKGDPNSGHVIVILISMSMILVEGITFLSSHEPNVVRWLLTGGLVFGLIMGVEWVRYLAALLYMLALGFALYVAITMTSLLLLGIAAYMAVVIYLLIGSSHVSAFYRARGRERRLTSPPSSE